MNIKITLSTGKEIVLTSAEYEELRSGTLPRYPPIYPAYPYYPTYPAYPTWTSSESTEVGTSWPQGSRETYGSKSTNRE